MIKKLMLDFKGDFSLPKTEEKVLEYWRADNTFKKSLAKRKGRKTFVFYEGPPTANGRPGIHHVLARAFKDIILRYKTMRGFYVPRKAGWDTHGLPVEVGVEKELGLKTKRDIEKFGIDLFNQKAKESVWKYKDEWERLTDRMGYWLGMEDPYITYDNDYIESLWWIFKVIADKGFLKESRRIVPYCPRCQTALSSHELAQPDVYKKVPDPSVYIKFRLKRPGSKNNNEYILVWTTTPWTLPSNMFIAADQKLTYTKYKVGGDYLWSYSAPPTPKLEDGSIPEIEAMEKISGAKLLGLSYEPLFDVPGADKKEMYKILPADFISTEDGTGFVHIAPAFGEDDFKLVAAHYPKMEVIATIDNEGRVTGDLPGSGKFIKDADADISADLTKRGIMYLSGKVEHEYPFCWRCGTPLIYFARKSWFFEVSRLRKELRERNAGINWEPAHLKEGRFGEWLKEAKDWSISRERYWGTPLPIWRCGHCDAMKTIGSRAELNANDVHKNQFYFARHTEADHILSGVIASGEESGKRVSHLTKKGIKAGEKIAAKLAKEKIDVIYSSPYARCVELAEIIKKATGAKIIVDERLSELDAGSFNWRKVKDYRKFFTNPMERFVKSAPGGETLSDVIKRTFDFARKINAKYRGKKIVVVSHGDPLWILESTLSLLPREKFAGAPYIKLGEVRKVKVPNLPMNEFGELDMHRPYVDSIAVSCPSCGEEMKRVKEVADVWLDSGAMPLAEEHFPFEQMKKGTIPGAKELSLINKISYPADYICEAMDQTRGWFYTLLALATLLGYKEPFKNVISLGLIHDKNGQKMSKHIGNVVSPWDMIEKYGVDAVRWYFYTVNPAGEPKNFDEAEIVKSYRKFHMLAFNSLVFFRTYGKSPSPKPGVSKNILDRWINARLSEAAKVVTESLEKYDVRDAGLALEEFTDDLSRWYIRRSRRRFQKAEDKKDFAAASDTLYSALLNLQKLSAPFMPFMSEAMYLELLSFAGKKKESVHLADWPKIAEVKNESLLAQMKEARKVSSLGLAARAAAGIKVRQPLKTLWIKESSAKIIKDKEILDIIRDEVNVKEVAPKKGIEGEVELDKEITPELKEEGLVREVMRAVQELRQSAKLSPKDKVFLMLALPADMELAVQSSEAKIKMEVGAKRIEYKKSEKFDAEIATKFDGAEAWLGLRKA